MEHERRCSKKHHQLYQKTIDLSENFSEQSPAAAILFLSLLSGLFSASTTVNIPSANKHIAYVMAKNTGSSSITTFYPADAETIGIYASKDKSNYAGLFTYEIR